MASHSLLTVRRALASAFDDLGVYVVAASTSTTATVAIMADSTPNASENRYDGRWVYSQLPQVQQRRVRTAGFTPSSGLLRVSTNWNPPQVGSELDLTGLFPCDSQVPAEDTSYRTLINRASGMLLVPDRLSIPITTSEVYPLTPYPWLDRQERITDIRAPAPMGSRSVSAIWRGTRLVHQGGVPSLEIAAPFEYAAGSLTLEVLRPADTLISGYETAPGTGGLQSDAQTTSAPIEELLLLAEMEGCRVLATRTVSRPDGSDWLKRYETARERAEQLMHFDGAFYKPRRSAGPAPTEAAA